MTLDIHTMIRKSLVIAVLCISSLVLKAQDADGVYSKVSELDEKPTPTKTVKPEYPSDLKREGITGIVSVSFVIDEKGNVTSADIKKSTHAGFEAAAKDSIMKWKFSPAKKGGSPVKVRVTIPVKFNLDD